MRLLPIITLALLAPLRAHAGSDINKDFTDCMLSKAKDGQYSSFDCGKSAMRLLVDCPNQWDVYVEACVKSGDTEGRCTLKSGVLAQTALSTNNSARAGDLSAARRDAL